MTLPVAHRVARRLSIAGVRGASRYWALAERLAPLPGAGLVHLPDGSPLELDPTDYTAVNTYRGLYERVELGLLPHLVRPGATVLDVGANIGVFTAHLSRLVGPTGRVVAVEPSPRCLPALERLAGRLGNVEVHAVAAGASEGSAVLRGHDREGHAGVGTIRAGLGGDGTTVRVVRLDDLVGDAALDLLKIDVEGFEPDALAGAHAALARTRHVLAEVSPEFDTAGWWGDLVAATASTHVAHAIEEHGRLVARRRLVPIDAADVAARPKQFNLLLTRSESAAELPL